MVSLLFLALSNKSSPGYYNGWRLPSISMCRFSATKSSFLTPSLSRFSSFLLPLQALVHLPLSQQHLLWKFFSPLISGLPERCNYIKGGFYPQNVNALQLRASGVANIPAGWSNTQVSHYPWPQKLSAPSQTSCPRVQQILQKPPQHPVRSCSHWQNPINTSFCFFLRQVSSAWFKKKKTKASSLDNPLALTFYLCGIGHFSQLLWIYLLNLKTLLHKCVVNIKIK